MGTYLDKYVPSYWLRNFEESEFVFAYLESLQELNSYRQYEYEAAVKAFACDPAGSSKRVPWYPIYLSFNKNTNFNSIRYGSGKEYDGSWVYGQIEKKCFWVIPAEMEDLGVITDSPVNPSKVWYPGQYQILKVNSEISILLLPVSIFDECSKVVETQEDRTLTLWAKQSSWKNALLFDLHQIPSGYFPDIKDRYAALALNAAYKSYAEGPSRETFVKFLSGLCRLPICIKAGEVQAISNTHVVVADVSYKRPAGEHTLAVAEGDILNFGDPIINEFKLVHGLGIGALDSLVIPYLPGSQSHYNVAILNAPETPVIYGVDSEGYSKAALNYVGERGEEFWDKVHELSKSSGKTLAQYLGNTTSAVVSQASLYPIRALELLASTALSHSYVIVVDSKLVNLENLELQVPKLQDLAGLGSSVYFKVIA